jgi:hypothetical protein
VADPPLIDDFELTTPTPCGTDGTSQYNWFNFDDGTNGGMLGDLFAPSSSSSGDYWLAVGEGTVRLVRSHKHAFATAITIAFPN